MDEEGVSLFVCVWGVFGRGRNTLALVYLSTMRSSILLLITKSIAGKGRWDEDGY